MAILAAIGICLVLGIICIASIKFLGPGNEIEKVTEKLLVEEAETVIHSKDDGKVDPSADKKDNK